MTSLVHRDDAVPRLSVASFSGMLDAAAALPQGWREGVAAGAEARQLLHWGVDELSAAYAARKAEWYERLEASMEQRLAHLFSWTKEPGVASVLGSADGADGAVAGDEAAAAAPAHDASYQPRVPGRVVLTTGGGEPVEVPASHAALCTLRLSSRMFSDHSVGPHLLPQGQPLSATPR